MYKSASNNMTSNSLTTMQQDFTPGCVSTETALTMEDLSNLITVLGEAGVSMPSLDEINPLYNQWDDEDEDAGEDDLDVDDDDVIWEDEDFDVDDDDFDLDDDEVDFDEIEDDDFEDDIEDHGHQVADGQPNPSYPMHEVNYTVAIA